MHGAEHRLLPAAGGGSVALVVLLCGAAAWMPAGCGESRGALPAAARPLDTPAPTTSSDASGDGGGRTGLCGRGTVCTVAGTGLAGDGEDGLPARETRLYFPQDAAFGPDGRLYVVDWNNHRIRAMGDDGRMQIVAGAGPLEPGWDDPAGDRLNHPTSIAFDPIGAFRMVIAAWHNSQIKELAADGTVSDLCGTGRRGFAGNGGPAAVATLDLPVGVAFDRAGNLLIADQANQMIRKVDRETSVITTVAGTGRCADSINPAPCHLDDGGPATSAGFHFPVGQSANPGGRIAVGPDGSIYVADTGHFRLRQIDPTGTIVTVAGNGRWGFAGDGGPATEAELGRLTDVAVARDGRLFIADTDNHCVRVVAPAANGESGSARTITTFAGRCGERGYAGDGGPATEALLDRPFSVEIGPRGEVVIADTYNNRIRLVEP